MIAFAVELFPGQGGQPPDVIEIVIAVPVLAVGKAAGKPALQLLTARFGQTGQLEGEPPLRRVGPQGQHGGQNQRGGTGGAQRPRMAALARPQPGAGSSYSFDCMTAACLGGVSIAGGEGKISGTVIGVIILGILDNGLVLMSVNTNWQSVIKGLILLAAVAIDCYQVVNKNKKKAAA